MQTRMTHTKANLTIRELGQDSKEKVIEGYFIRFNEETELWEDCFEEIAPESVISSLDNEIKCLFNHNRGVVMGSKNNSTLTLRADNIGLWGSVTVNENDSEAMDIYARVERGDIRNSSFGFMPLKEVVEIDEEGRVHIRITKMDLKEVSIVAFPAYKNTSLEARQEQVEKIVDRKLDETKNKILEKYEKEKQ